MPVRRFRFDVRHALHCRDVKGTLVATVDSPPAPRVHDNAAGEPQARRSLRVVCLPGSKRCLESCLGISIIDMQSIGIPDAGFS